MSLNGIFITFEGGEGVGKTTQIELVAARFEALGHTVVKTLEPGGTPLGVKIRKSLVSISEDPPSPTAELLLYAADRAHHVEKVIKPALERGEVVLCDRFADATEAYQGWGRGLDLELIRELNRVATSGVTPVRTILMDFDPSTGVQRSLDRQNHHSHPEESRFEMEKTSFHERVREGYLFLARLHPGRIRTVDAQGSVEEVQERVWRELRDLANVPPDGSGGGGA